MEKPKGMRLKRTPVIMLIDTSGSMEGIAIEQVNQGLSNYIKGIKEDENLLKVVDLTIITFNSQVEVIFEHQALENIDDIDIPTLSAGGLTMLDKGLREVMELVERKITIKGNRGPLFIFMSDGNPTRNCNWESELARLNDNPITGYGARAILGAGNDINDNVLKAFVRDKELDRVLRVADVENLKDFFQYLRTITQEYSKGKQTSMPDDVLPDNKRDSIQLVDDQ